jgi:hypothetical protein
MKITTDKIVRRLRWVVVCVTLSDKFVTLLGQPHTYWLHPERVNEGNHLVRYFLSRGLPAYLLYSLAEFSITFLLISILPRRLALVLSFTAIFGHFFGAGTWLVYVWHFGVTAPMIYSVVLSAALVSLAFPTPEKPNVEKLSSNESAA